MLSELILGENGYSFFYVGRDLSEYFSLNNIKRVTLKIEENEPLHQELRKSNLGFKLTLSKRTIKEFNLEVGKSYNIEVKEDSSKYQFKFPEILNKIFYQDSEAEKLFEKLTAGKQRSILHKINTVKSIDRQIDTAYRILNNLKDGAVSLREIMK